MDELMDRWLLVLAEIELRLETTDGLDADELADITARHSTDRCESCTDDECCDLARLNELLRRTVDEVRNQTD